MTPRCMALVVLTTVVVVGGCAHDLDSVPLPCFDDKDCPDGLQCSNEKRCVAGNVDAAVVDGPGKKPDGKAPKPDGKAPKPDGTAPKPDGTAPKPDGTAPKPDSKTPKPDGTAPKPDSKAPKPDSTAPKPDSKALKPDAVPKPDMPKPDSKVPTPDAAPKPDTAPPCGNGKINPGEQCDGNNLDAKTCTSLKFDGGTLKCDPKCNFDTSGCHKCGDGKVNGTEQCDGSALGGQTCSGLGFSSGALTCRKDCTYERKTCRTGGYITIPLTFPTTYTMAGPNSDPCRQANEHPRSVTLTNKFEIMHTETYQVSFQKILKHNPSTKVDGGLPVHGVTWHQAVDFCNRGSIGTGATECYSCSGSQTPGVKCTTKSQFSGSNIYKCDGFRLPTEAEWELAYRAGGTGSTHKGKINNCKTADTVANQAGWYSGNSNMTGPKTPGAYKNAWGIQDMAGNLWEWTHDGYQTNLSTTPSTNPVGSGTDSTVRGGDWGSYAQAIRAASRGGHPKTGFVGYKHLVGFRCVRIVK